MCDDSTVRDNEDFLRNSGALSRRRFNLIAAGSAMAVLLPQPAHAQDVIETDVVVTTPDGSADCYFVHPASGRHPAVIVWPDIVGLRPAFRMMGKRLAESGYSVLVVNPYYRTVAAPVVPAGASFQDPATREILMPLARSLSAATNVTDAKAFVAYLDQQKSVDTSRGIGTTGYCMGGPITMRTAAAVPDRIAATASFHGGRLVTDTPDSPHLLIPQIRASALFAVAENDDEKEPQLKDVLRDAYQTAGLSGEIQVYARAMHGWCPPDSAVYNEAQAERAWARLLDLFEKALV